MPSAISRGSRRPSSKNRNKRDRAAANQPAGESMAESIAEFMDRRQREVARRGAQAEAVAHNAWAASTRTGRNLVAPTSSEVVALGGKVLAGQQPGTGFSARQAAYSPGSQDRRPAPIQSGASTLRPPVAPVAARMYVPPADDLAQLRRQQAEFKQVTRDISRQNSWMAVPALAPAAVVLALEGGAAIAAGLAAAPQARRAALSFLERDRYLRLGENVTTRAGRRAHKALEERLKEKPGWDYEPKVNGPNGLRKPDVGAPARSPAKPEKRYQMEYKPNTPSGRRAGERAARMYERETGNKTRPIYYDPKDFM